MSATEGKSEGKRRLLADSEWARRILAIFAIVHISTENSRSTEIQRATQIQNEEREMHETTPTDHIPFRL